MHVVAYTLSMPVVLDNSIGATCLPRRSGFWAQFPGLVWSNSRASDIVMIRAALSRPRFEQLLKIAVEFGLEYLQTEWKVLDEENTSETQRARPVAERILQNIEQGFSNAKARN